MRLCTLLLVLSACLSRPASVLAQLSGISYTLAPLAGRVYFDKNAGLSDATLVGGRLGFGFGEYAELSGLYLVSTDLSTDFADFSDLGSALRDRFAELPPRDVSMRQYGADLKFNLGRGALLPFVSIGTGILRFDPENLEQSRTIYLTGAAGLQLGLSDRLSLVVSIEDLVYRYTPPNALLSESDLGDLGLGSADFRQVNVNNLVVRAGIQMYAGGRAPGELTAVDRALREQFSRGISGIRLQVEPFGGVVEFAEELGFRERQRMAGVHAGFDLGPYLGLRGFFWRGMDEKSLTDFEQIQAYGGEIKLKFGEIANRLVPHLLLGGGYFDVLEGYRGNGEARPVDRPFASGGAGLTLPLTRTIGLHASVRALLLSTEEAENVADPARITTNLFYSAGISFGLGAPSAESPRRIPVSSTEAALARAQRRIDSLTVALAPARRFDAGTADSASLGPAGDRQWITIPIPENGEFYVRYGEGGRIARVDAETGAVERDAAPSESLTAEEIRKIVRDVMQRELRRDEQPREEDETVRLLLERIDEMEERLDRRESPGEARPAGYELAAVLPFGGFGLSGNQAVLAGLRADLRSPSLSGARFLPELVVGAGTDGLTYAVNLDASFPIGFHARSVRPYAGLGFGFLTIDGAELVFNLLAGVERGPFFAEYMSQDFFDFNRIALGYRLSF